MAKKPIPDFSERERIPMSNENPLIRFNFEQIPTQIRTTAQGEERAIQGGHPLFCVPVPCVPQKGDSLR